MFFEDRVAGRRANAAFGWLLTGVVTLGAVESALTDALLWSGFSLVVVAIISLPALLTRDPDAIVHWPLLALAAIGVGVRAVGFYPELAGYVAIAALALIVVVELDVFTEVDLSRRVAVGFGVLTSLAIEALWIVAQFYSDVWFGTDFLRSQRDVQIAIVLVTAIGFIVGALFYWYVAAIAPTALDYSSNRAEIS